MTGLPRDEVDDLVAARAPLAPGEESERRLAALEADQRRLDLAAARAQVLARRRLWWSLAGVWLLAATLPWLTLDGEARSYSLFSAVLRTEALIPLATTVVLPAAFVAVLAWKVPRVGGALMLLLAAYLAGVGFRSEHADVPLGPVVAALALVVGGVARLLGDEN